MGGGRKEVACGKCDMCSLFLNFVLIFDSCASIFSYCLVSEFA